MEISFALAALIAWIISYCGIRLSLRYFPRWGIVDRREAHSTHVRTAVRGGGIAIYIGFLLTLILFHPNINILWGFLIASFLIVIVNFWDDARNIPWYFRLGTEIVAAMIVIAYGVDIDIITSPFGGVIDLSLGTFSINGFEISPLADGLALIWIVGLMNVFNWLDGLDGLAGGVGAISSLVLFVLSLLPFVMQPLMALMALTLFAAIMGFLPYNFFRGSIKLGDTGAKFLGFTLAVMAILNKGKVATFMLLLGLPLLDFVWVIIRRMFIDKKSIFQGDQGHFHHRLLRVGLSRKQTVIVMWCISAIFGILALVLRNALQKLIALVIMLMILLIFAVWVVKREKHIPQHYKDKY